MTTINGVHFKSPSGVRVDIDMTQFNQNLKLAQYWLDSQVMSDMIPLMPMDTGTFIHNTVSRSQSLAGTGVVCAAAPPYGRYLYYGKVMVDSETGKGARPITLKTGEVIFRHRRGATLTPTSRPLTYQNPDAVPEWFEVAKEQHYRDWCDGVAKILGGTYG